MRYRGWEWRVIRKDWRWLRIIMVLLWVCFALPSSCVPASMQKLHWGNLCQGTSVHISGNVALGAQGRGFTGMVNSCCELRPWGKKTVEVGEESGVGACSSFLQIWTNYFLLNLKSCGIENLFISKATPSPIHNVIFKLVHGGNWLIN